VQNKENIKWYTSWEVRLKREDPHNDSYKRRVAVMLGIFIK
jgi:hypothetical protein